MSEENNLLKEVTHTPSHLQWFRVEELGYTDSSPLPPPDASEEKGLCFGCNTMHPKTELLKCGKCRVARYCSKECQVKDWKRGGQHKASCDTYKRAGPDMCGLENDNIAAQEEARIEIFHRIRFYSCAYAVFKAATLGRGFLFIQGDQSLVSLSLAIPKDCYGRTLPTRGLLVHYLTVGEFDSEVCRDDFEMAMVRKDLLKAVEEYDEQTEVVLLMRFRCGHTAVGKAQLVMPYASFRKLGSDFFAEQNAPCLQLNIDDV